MFGITCINPQSLAQEHVFINKLPNTSVHLFLLFRKANWSTPPHNSYWIRERDSEYFTKLFLGSVLQLCWNRTITSCTVSTKSIHTMHFFVYWTELNPKSETKSFCIKWLLCFFVQCSLQPQRSWTCSDTMKEKLIQRTWSSVSKQLPTRNRWISTDKYGMKIELTTGRFI